MRALIALGALVLLAVAFALLAPATLIDRRVDAATQGRVRLADATGTVWRGAGSLADAQGRWHIPVAWRVDMASLARGALSAELVPDARADARGSVLAEGDAIHVSALHLELPARALEALWTQPPVPRLDGILVVDAPTFTTDGRNAQGRFDVRWTGARASLAGFAVNLGSVEAHGAPAGGDVAIALRGTGGDVALQGSTLLRQGRLSGDVTLTPAPALPAPLAVALRALGRTDPDGTIHLTWAAGR